MVGTTFVVCDRYTEQPLQSIFLPHKITKPPKVGIRNSDMTQCSTIGAYWTKYSLILAGITIEMTQIA